MFAEVDVFISNYTLVDPEVYQLWVDGCPCKYWVVFLISSKVTDKVHFFGYLVV